MTNGRVLYRTSDGQCDARCYDATGTECTCVCGGRYHGVGLAVAEHLLSTSGRPDVQLGLDLWQINEEDDER